MVHIANRMKCVVVFIVVVTLVILVVVLLQHLPARKDDKYGAKRTNLLFDNTQGNRGVGLITNALPTNVTVYDFIRATPSFVTPLVSAAGSGRLDIVKALVAQGADVNEKSKGFHGWTPLIAAMMYTPRSDVIDFLLAHGADPNIMDDALGMNALGYAISFGDSYSNVVKKLIEKGANLNTIDKYGTSALALARGTPDTSVIKDILRHSGAKE